jgi:hypothetical protein
LSAARLGVPRAAQTTPSEAPPAASPHGRRAGHRGAIGDKKEIGAMSKLLDEIVEVVNRHPEGDLDGVVSALAGTLSSVLLENYLDPQAEARSFAEWLIKHVDDSVARQARHRGALACGARNGQNVRTRFA